MIINGTYARMKIRMMKKEVEEAMLLALRTELNESWCEKVLKSQSVTFPAKLSPSARYKVHAWVEMQGADVQSVSSGRDNERRLTVTRGFPKRDKEWCEETLKALRAEREAETEEIEATLRQCSALECARQGISILGLRTAEIDAAGPGGRTRVKLKPGHGGFLGPHKLNLRAEVLLKNKANNLGVPGVLSKAENHSLEMLTDDEVSAVEALGQASLRLDIRPNEASNAQLVACVKKVKALIDKDDTPLFRTLLGRYSEEEEEDDEKNAPFILEKERYMTKAIANLNQGQRAAVDMALQDQFPVSIIHGPPGTGKTTTVAALITALVDQGLRVLAAAPSNIAVDNLLDRVASILNTTNANSTKAKKKKKNKVAPLLRLGHPARLSKIAAVYSFEARLAAQDGADVLSGLKSEMREFSKSRDKALRRQGRALRAELRAREKHLAKQVITTSKVVFATCVGAARLHDDAKTNTFDVIVIDEAAQAPEIATWIPLLLGKRAILAGDHKQLAPTVKSEKAALLCHTLFDRLVDKCPTSLLTTQYRMHALISDWASDASYQGKLLPAEDIAHLTIPDLPVLRVIDTSGAGFYDDSNTIDPHTPDLKSSIANPQEAEVVVSQVRRLLTRLPPTEVCVISPYNAQLAAIRDSLQRRLPEDQAQAIDVKTVDGYQGGERTAIVISLTRSNDRREIGFLADERRFNVACTRAKRHLCLVCDSETVRTSPFIASLLDHIEMHGEYSFYDPDDAYSSCDDLAEDS